MSKIYNITLLPGDGIGPEVIAESVKVLDAVAVEGGFALEYTTRNAGGAAIDAHNDPMPDEVVATCKASDAVLLGAVGGTKWDHLTGALRPESGLLKIRQELGAFANLRPVSVPESLAENSPLRKEAVAGLDLFTVRELTGGIYFGQPVGEEGEGDPSGAGRNARAGRRRGAHASRPRLLPGARHDPGPHIRQPAGQGDGSVPGTGRQPARPRRPVARDHRLHLPPPDVDARCARCGAWR